MPAGGKLRLAGSLLTVIAAVAIALGCVAPRRLASRHDAGELTTIQDADTLSESCTPCRCCCAREWDGGAVADGGGDLPRQNAEMCSKCLADPESFPCEAIQ